MRDRHYRNRDKRVMTPTQARRAMRKPRYTRRGKGGVGKGWYYVEDEGISVLAVQDGVGTQVRLTWQQIEQAMELRRLSKIG